MKYRGILLAACLAASTMVWGQPWLKSAADAPVTGSSANINEIRTAFDSWFETHDQGKGTGYKQFRRYLAFMEPRVYPSGQFPADALWKAWQNAPRTKSGSSVSDWTPLGPVAVTQNFYGSPVGVGRINCIAFHPTNPLIIYVGAPSGGVWKTIDGGATWSTTTDHLPALGVADIAINPKNPEIVYVATGDEDFGNTCPTYSFGVMVSTNGGATWNQTGLTHNTSDQISLSRILVNPDNPDIVIAGGSPGIYRSTDAGATWTKVSSAGTIRDLEFKPDNSSVIYACTNSVIYKSTDAGLTFTQAMQGLPSSGMRRIELAVTKANPSVVYAVMSNSESGYLGLYKSTDAGETWTTRSTEADINIFGYESNGSGNTGIAWYAMALAVDQQDENILYSGSVNIWKSTNSGQNWSLVTNSGGSYVHVDLHTLVINPQNNICYAGNDGGIYKTTDKGTTWSDISAGLSILQVYRMGASASNPDYILEGSQDNGTFLYNKGQWNHVLGGDGMDCTIDPFNHTIMYASWQNGGMMKSTNSGVDWQGIKPDEKGAWITPYQTSQINRGLLVAGFKSVFLSTTYGNSWRKISGELAGGSFFNEIAPAPSDDAWIYVTSGSSIWGTRDYGANWSPLKAGLPDLYIEGLAVAPAEPEKIWVALSGYTDGQKVFFSDDGGENWVNWSAGLPNVPVNCLTINKLSHYAMYAGTDLGVYYRKPGMNEWVPFSDGLPNVIVNELDINYKINKIRAATFGRGIWESPINDDGNWPPARQLTADEQASSIVLGWLPAAGREPSSYAVYRDTVLIGSVSGTSFTDPVETGMSHAYQVKAIYPDGESTPTNRLIAMATTSVTFPYNQDFATQAHGWLIQKKTSDWQWGTGTDFQMNLLGTSNFLAINSVAANAIGKHATGYAIFPKMDLSSLTAPVLTCRYSLKRWQNLDHLYLVYRSADVPVWDTLAELIPTGRVWAWKKFNFTIPAELLVPDVEFAFYYTDSRGIGFGAAIDDVYIGPDVSGTNDLSLPQRVTLFPNPTDGEVSLQLEGFGSDGAVIDLLDARGRAILNKTVPPGSPGVTEQINLHGVSRGLYYIRVVSGGDQWIKPVVRR